MCGITGFFEKGRSPKECKQALRDMTAALVHRGPDAEGFWSDEREGIHLGHRRLSILDLTSTGNQPMASESGRYQLVFNGEIYNFQELRKELAGHGQRFRGSSDTEVMLAAFEHWGLEGSLKKFVGMFAFAVWDREKKSLNLARDRFGEKPLYYGWQGTCFLFGSELKALRRHPAFLGNIDRHSLGLMMRYSYVPSPHSIYSNISKLKPGCFLTFYPEKGSGEPGFIQAYWSADEVVRSGANKSVTGSMDEVSRELEELLSRAVREQMVADVPLGAFLSGGVDSSVIVALMQKQSSKPIKTFTIGFQEEAYDEAPQARKVARYLGTEHTQLYVSPEDALAVVPSLPNLYDEPFSDPSQIPTSLLARLTHNMVTVSLSGDGGDELFGGYNRYLLINRLGPLLKKTPGWLRRTLAASITPFSPAAWDKVLSIFPIANHYHFTGDRLHKLAGILGIGGVEKFYDALTTDWGNTSELIIGSSGDSVTEEWPVPAVLKDLVPSMMFLDMVTYLPDDVLVKIDRAAMAVSLETRVPYLDHRVAEFALNLPLSFKVSGGQTKRILREILYRHVPKELADRPKMGFGVPLDSWLRGPLREWAEALLDEGLLKRQGFLNPKPIRQKWAEHLSGKRNWQYLLWDVLMWQAWLDGQSPLK